MLPTFQNAMRPVLSLINQPVLSTGFTSQPGNGTTDLTTPTAIGQAALLFGSDMEQQEGCTYLALSGNITHPDLLALMGSIMPVEMMHYTAL